MTPAALPPVDLKLPRAVFAVARMTGLEVGLKAARPDIGSSQHKISSACNFNFERVVKVLNSTFAKVLKVTLNLQQKCDRMSRFVPE